ncbi:MAG: hypothetical protein V2A79_12455 [Planctomycetota bacterium]
MRVVFPGGRNRPAIASLLVAGVAAVGSWAAYWAWHRDTVLVGQTRGPEDVSFNWRCPNGHPFPAPGAYDPKPCPACGQLAYVHISYTCPECGPCDLPVLFDRATKKVGKVQYKPDEWASALPFIRCPACGHQMDSRPKKSKRFEAPKSGIPKNAGGASTHPPATRPP